MSIAHVSGVIASSRIGTASAEPPTPTTPVRPTALPTPTPLEAGLDDVAQQPLPPRFPWLSRLSQQLERASGRKSAFAPAPPLGDNIDRSA